MSTGFPLWLLAVPAEVDLSGGMHFSFLPLGNDKPKRLFFRFSSVVAEDPLAFLALCCDVPGLLEEYMQILMT